MEFFQEVPAPSLDAARLKNLLTINNLTKLCASIDNIISAKSDEAEIYCLWGEFSVRRLEIRHGVRFSLLNCPHALAWSVTYHDENKNIIIHCTIDSKEANTDFDFIDSVNTFVDDWSEGITKALEI